MDLLNKMAIVLGKEEEKDPIRTEDKGEWFLNAKCKMQNAKCTTLTMRRARKEIDRRRDGCVFR